MELFYTSPDGKEINWLVAEVVAGQSYRIIDTTGKPNPQGVKHAKGRSITMVFFDGFVVEDNKVFATALLTRTPKIEVGHSPRTV